MEVFPVALSISSFNKLLAKSLALAFLIIVTYSLILMGLNPKITKFQNQWVANYARAESYLYRQSPPRAIIVGSSMAANLKEEKLDSYIHNLSFAGGSALTGLKIIKKCSNIPDIICVETNIIEGASNEEMINSLFTPVLWRIKKHLVALRYTYEPMNIFITFMTNKYGKKHTGQNKEKPNEDILKRELARHLERENSVDGLATSKEIAELKGLIEYFYCKGTKVVFFQMPVHPQIASSKRYKERKAILRRMFKGENIKWMENPTDADTKFETADGIHLMPESALSYSIEFNNIIKKISYTNASFLFKYRPGTGVTRG